ncbi:hypothetical protein [Idiomarina seosinensis]|uniref:Uncharacterized protein n=1 Tax=Idiomarina seosinensis TaxID=281739 RepID=A0A432ZI90_9GAMM|nr:hypothetical protein [Idiomarina seosinensis]RUO77604.1 hypothetical protein CWI81_03765 [Idiomarina seosinensis]
MRVGSVRELKQLSFWTRVLGWLSIVGWIIFIAALVVYHYARPEHDTLLTEIFGISVRDYWHITLGELFIVLLMFGLLISLIAFTINLVLFSQNRQHLWLNNLILIFTCVGGLALYFLTTV